MSLGEGFWLQIPLRAISEHVVSVGAKTRVLPARIASLTAKSKGWICMAHPQASLPSPRKIRRTRPALPPKYDLGRLGKDQKKIRPPPKVMAPWQCEAPGMVGKKSRNTKGKKYSGTSFGIFEPQYYGKCHIIPIFIWNRVPALNLDLNLVEEILRKK